MNLVRTSEDGPGAALLSPFEAYLRERGPALFVPGEAITVARAPARIDCMGGIADYSGSVVFEAPLARAAVVAFQPQARNVLRARSATLEQAGRPAEATTELSALRSDAGGLKPYPELRSVLAREPDQAWAAYLLGTLAVLDREGIHALDSGGAFLLWSDIPIGVGVASSAALEVAAMFAVCSHFGLELSGPRFAELAQKVENHVVGAPCGIMDQVTSALGEEGKLLALRCQPTAEPSPAPCELLGQHELPDGVRLFGLSSRVEHRVGGSAYAKARTSAFMGLKIILTEKEKQGRRLRDRDHYLCNLAPEEYLADYRGSLPDRITGRDFLGAWGETTDPVTAVEADAVYRVRTGADHPVFENFRVQAFIECMDRARRGDRTALVEAGGLMYASHWSYGWNCGLGCAETDLLVRLVRRRGPEQGLYGAKITGGGSGGTVAILADADAADVVARIADEYREETGREPDLFDGTSPGAFAFGPRSYRLQED